MKKKTVILLLSLILVLAAGAVWGVIYLYAPLETTDSAPVRAMQQNDTAILNELP